MDQINKQASYGTVTAPCAGTVTAVNVVQGGMASSAQPAVVIAEDSRVKINASVSEDVFAGLHTGDSAGVQISVLSDEVKSAKDRLAPGSGQPSKPISMTYRSRFRPAPSRPSARSRPSSSTPTAARTRSPFRPTAC